MSLTHASKVPLSAFAARLLIIAAIFLLALVVELRGGSPYSERELAALWALVISGFGLTLVYDYLLKYRRGWGLPYLEVAGDGLLIATLVYCTGGPRSLFGFLFLIWIVHAALRCGPRSAVAAASAAVLVFGMLCIGPPEGWFPAFEGAPSPEEALRVAGTHSLAFVGVAFLAHHLARENQEHRHELHGLGELNQRIMDNVPSGLLTVGANGVISSFNREAEHITGWSARRALGARLEQLFPTLPATESESRGELRYRRDTGEELHIGYSRSALRDDRGRTEGGVLIFQDLTHVKQMEEQLRRSERLSAVGQLAAGLAHEIRNPLASLSGAIELLGNDLPTLGQVGSPDASSRRLLRIVRRETERLNRLVADFLSYAGPGPKRREPIALLELLDELRQLLASGEYSNIRLELAVPEQLRAWGDPDQLRQVFWNLVLNAAEASPADGLIRLTGERAAAGSNGVGWVAIHVEDHGTGIPAEHLERIFEPFFTTRPKGTGLGLATVHRVVEAHGGRLQVRSSEGQGTTLSVFLPEGDA